MNNTIILPEVGKIYPIWNWLTFPRCLYGFCLSIQVISLILELLTRSVNDWLDGTCSVLLLSLLELLLIVEEPTTKKLATDLLQKLLQQSQELGVPLR